MAKKTLILLSLKWVVLTLLLFFSYIIASMLAGLTEFAPPGDLNGTMLTLMGVCALQAGVLSYPVIRSGWTGWRLALTIFLIFFGVMTFLSQIEAIVFLNYLINVIPAALIPKLFVQGAVIAVLFSPSVVVIHGRMKKNGEMPETKRRLLMPWTEWVWKLTLIAVIYVIIYSLFGMFVFKPIAGEAFGKYYENLKMPLWILPFQMLRAMIWTALALPVIRMMKGGWWESGLAVALLFSILMSSQLLLHNDFMPDKIRIAHFIEVFSSNFLFGWIVVWLLYRYKNSKKCENISIII